MKNETSIDESTMNSKMRSIRHIFKEMFVGDDYTLYTILQKCGWIWRRQM